MIISSIRAQALVIPFVERFSPAVATRSTTESIWVEIEDLIGTRGIGEGCPRRYVTGENVAGALEFVSRYAVRWRENIGSLVDLRRWCAEHASIIDAHPAAWCAVELAFLDLFGKHQGRSLEHMLASRPLGSRYRYSAVIGDSSAAAFRHQLERYRAFEFSDYKITLSGDMDRDRDKVAALKAAGIAPKQVRADATNLWLSATPAIAHLAALAYPFCAVEEPLRPGNFSGFAEIAAALDCAVVLDETVTRAEHLDALPAGPTWWLNLRVSKMGGVLRSLDIAARAARRSLPVVVGAYVGETGVLTRAALTIAASAGTGLIAQEGAFGRHLLAHDVVNEKLEFGHGGWLVPGDLARAPGLGLSVCESLVKAHAIPMIKTDD